MLLWRERERSARRLRWAIMTHTEAIRTRKMTRMMMNWMLRPSGFGEEESAADDIGVELRVELSVAGSGSEATSEDRVGVSRNISSQSSSFVVP